MDPVFIVIVLIVVAIGIRLISGSFDGERVERYLDERGWKLVDRSWDPFGPGWFGEQDSRIYQVVYRDEQGRLHRAHVKTSMLSGVYLANDRIVEAKQPPAPPDADSLAEENRRLKERIRELENGKS